MNAFAQTTLTTTTTEVESGALAGAFLIASLIAIPIIIFVIASMWKVFTKAGKPGWAALVPFYNTYILIEISGKPTNWFWIILALNFASIIPFVGLFTSIAVLVMMIMVMIDLGAKFGKSTLFSVLGLVLFPIVGFPMLAFGDAQYNADAPSPTEPTQPTSEAKSE